MKLAELAKELKISTESFIRFIQDFDLELSECIDTSFEVRPDFIRFARENASFLQRYERDLKTDKSIEEIANDLKTSPDKVTAVLEKQSPPIYDEGRYRSSVSTFSIDNKLGGNYQFVYNYFGNKTNLAERDFIGYRDLFFYISNSLQSFLAPDTLAHWGIRCAAGIVLYGPPGSGKIFWANKIAQIINYELREVRKHFIGQFYDDGSKMHFNDFLVKMMKEKRILLFMEDFEAIMAYRESEIFPGADDIKEIVLHYISHFEKEQIVMVGSATSVQHIDRELLAPGRFDVMVPIFPPNERERAEMILHFMLENLSENAPLKKILQNSKATAIPFWQPIATQMKGFSNTMIADFTQSLKKRLRSKWLNKDLSGATLDENSLVAALRDASAKLTGEYLDQIAQFIADVKRNNLGDFTSRLQALEEELNTYRITETPKQPIGFPHNDALEPKK